MKAEFFFTTLFDNLEEALESKNLFNFVLSSKGLLEVIKEPLYTVAIKRKKGFELPVNFTDKQYFTFNNTDYSIEKSGIGVKINNQYINTWEFNDMPKIPSSFQYNLPKIPYGILVEIIWFFKTVARVSHTEVMLEVYYNHNSKQYCLICPKQIVNETNVIYLRETLPNENLQKVMEIHSHHILPAVFSKTDDNDEKKNNIIYGVVGGFAKNDQKSNLSFRVFSKGDYKYLQLEDIFKDKKDFNSSRLVQKFKSDYKRWMENIEIRKKITTK